MRMVLLLLALWLGMPATQGAARETTDSLALERLKRSTSESLSAAGALASQKKAEAEKHFEKELKGLDQNIEELKVKAREAGAEATAKAASYLPDLEKRKAELEANLDDLKTRSGYAWDDMATSTDKAIKELKFGYEKAKSRFE